VRWKGLSPGQANELDRVGSDFLHLIDDGFVAQHRERWLAVISNSGLSLGGA
jgi:hypothetical protein